MPLTRNKSHAADIDRGEAEIVSDLPTQQSISTTRSGRIIQQPYGLQDDINPRSAKRQRIESTEPTKPDPPPDILQDPPGAVEAVHTKNRQDQKAFELAKVSTNGATSKSQYTGTMGKSTRSSASASATKLVSRMKVESLPILDNLSTQILFTLSKSTPQEVAALIATPDSENGRDFATVRSLFSHTKRVYSVSAAFLSARELELQRPEQIEVLRKANFATFFSSILSREIDLKDLDDPFLNIFVPENGRLLKAQASILLDLKTQAFLSASTVTPAASGDILSLYFPENMEDKLLGKRPGARTLVPSEQDFIKRLMSRRDILLAEIGKNAITSLADRYKWEDFVRDVSSYLSRNFDTICPVPDKDKLGGRLVSANSGKGLQQGEMEGQFSIHGPPMPVQEVQSPPIVALPRPVSPPKPAVLSPAPEPLQELQQEDFVAKAARAAQIALEGQSRDFSFPSPYRPPQLPQFSPPAYSQAEPSFQHYNPPQGSISPPKPNNNSADESRSEVPHSSQTAPTQVLYERARMAATAKTSPVNRKTSTPSQRRPWTTEEENALMAGLDRVRGPHWSQILAMFGPGGTINESLKDRNQVQLKDKARNLKLFFLKSGIEVPYYLKYVTGDLRTRAPAQASKQEARERERQRGLEDKAHFDGVQGIMALAVGHSQQPEGSNVSPMLESADSIDMSLPEDELDPEDADGDLLLKEEL